MSPDDIKALARKRAEAMKRQRERAEEALETERARLKALRRAALDADRERFGALVIYLAALSHTAERYISVDDLATDLDLTKAEVSSFCRHKLGLYQHHSDSSLLVIPRECRYIQQVRKGPKEKKWLPCDPAYIWTDLWKWTPPDPE